MADDTPVNLNARVQAIEVAIQLISEHLRNTSEGFSAVANERVIQEAAQIQKFATQDKKEYGKLVVDNLKILLHVPDA